MDRLRIFVSSTQKDLQSERNRAEAVISELGHQCLRAETHDAPGYSPEEACMALATSCDIYVGIFGSRYGYVVPHLGCSATEMEFQAARAVNPGKVLVYLKHASDVEGEQARFLQKVQDFSAGYFRHQLFQTDADLADQIRRDLVTWMSKKVRETLAKEIELRALRDKVAHLSRVMELYGVPENLR